MYMETSHNNGEELIGDGVVNLEKRLEDTSAEIDRLSIEYAELIHEIETTKKENPDSISAHDMALFIKAEKLKNQLDELIRENETNAMALEMIEPLKAKIDQMFVDLPVSTKTQ